MKTICTIIATLALTGSALAGDTNLSSEADSNSQSGSYSGVNIEGSEAYRNTPGLGGSGGNSTADCVIAYGGGLVVPGFGIQRHNGRIDNDCVTRREARILHDIAGMRSGPQKTATILHFCRNDVSMRETMQQLGWCRTGSAATVSSKSDLTRCELVGGKLRIGLRRGLSQSRKQAAVQSCRSRF